MILKYYDSSLENRSEVFSLPSQVDVISFDEEFVESGVGGRDGLAMVSSVDEDTSASLQSIASNLCCMHLFSGLFNTEWMKSRVSARKAFTLSWRMLFRRIKAIVRTTISKRPFRLARNTFQCSFMSAGTLAETFGEEEVTMIGAQETLGLSGSHRGLSGGVKDVSSREDSFVSNRLNSSLCCFATAPLRTLCLRREHGIVDVLTTGSSDK